MPHGLRATLLPCLLPGLHAVSVRKDFVPHQVRTLRKRSGARAAISLLSVCCVDNHTRLTRPSVKQLAGSIPAGLGKHCIRAVAAVSHHLRGRLHLFVLQLHGVPIAGNGRVHQRHPQVSLLRDGAEFVLCRAFLQDKGAQDVCIAFRRADGRFSEEGRRGVWQ